MFYSALNISGTYFVPILFCLAPPFMAWLVRSYDDNTARGWSGVSYQPTWEICCLPLFNHPRVDTTGGALGKLNDSQ